MKCRRIILVFILSASSASAQTASPGVRRPAQASPLSIALDQIRPSIEKSNFSDALKKFQKGAPQEVLSSEAGQFVDGYLSFKAGKTQLAKDQLQKVAEAKGGLGAYAAHLLGQLALKAGQAAEARRFFELTDSFNPQEKLWNENALELVQLDIQDKNWQSVRKRLPTLEKNLRRETDFPRILWIRAQTEEALGQKDRVCQTLRKIYRDFPHFGAVSAWGYDLAANEFQGRKTGCSWDSEDFRQRIRMLVFHGEHTEAEKEVHERRKILAQDSPFEADYLYAQFLLMNGEPQRALKIAKPYFDRQKSPDQFQIFMASVFARSGEHAAAVGIYDSLAKRTRGRMGIEYRYRAAVLCYQTQDYDCAIKRFRELVKVGRSSRQALEGRWHLAWIAYLKGRYANALDELRRVPAGKRARQLNTFQKRVLFWKAVTEVKLKKYEVARSDFETLLKEDPTGFYGLAAQSRLAQLQILSPKSTELSSADQSRLKLLRAMLSFHPSMTSKIAELPHPPAATSGNADSIEDKDAEVAIQEWEESDVPVAGTEGGSLDALETPPEGSDALATPSRVESALLNVRLLASLGLEEWARWELFTIEKGLSRGSPYRPRLIQEYERLAMYHRSSLLSQRLWSGKLDDTPEGKLLAQSTYPLAFRSDVEKYSQEFEVPMEFILSIMRAESSYRAQATSPVGALGLMQVMPQTGRRVADLLGERNFEPKSLLQPYQAIRFGSRYLSRLLNQFNRNMVLASAAYNAGPHRVKQWVTQFGELEVDEFIEHIPFVETRNYVKKVLAFTLIYRTVYPEVFQSKQSPIPNLATTLNFRYEGVPPTRELWDDI